jgi:hypothetical protein
MDERPPIDFDDVERRETLPLLAWALTLRGARATLVAGSGVEIADGTCFEGAWSDEGLDLRSYARPDRRAGRSFFGSAAVRLAPSEVLCIPPTHTLEGLYVVIPHDGGGFTVTNSIVWAMREAGTDLIAPVVTSLTAAIQSTSAGLLGYKRLLTETKTASLIRIVYAPFVVDATRGVITEEPITVVRESGEFTFAGYRDELLAALWRTWLNATARERRYRYQRLHSTMSSGYDSSACAALAKGLGFREPISLDTSRGGDDDTGRLAGAQMGLEVRVFPRPGRDIEHWNARVLNHVVDVERLRQETGKSYAEFIAPLACFGDLVWDAFEPALPGAIVISGHHGAQAWGAKGPPGPWITRTSQAGAGLGEFRLRTGFVHLLVATVHLRRWQTLRRLSQSPEIRPYHLGTDYERPIARRLVEEAGASRESFGVRKKAAHVAIDVKLDGIVAAYEEVAARYD